MITKKRKLNKKINDDSDDDGSINNSTVLINSISNHIYMYNDITTKSIFELNKQIQTIELGLSNLGKYNFEDKAIYIHIHSTGGDLFAGLALVDIIKNSNIKIITIIEGYAASAATLGAVVGNKRLMTENSYMLIHQLSSSFWGKYAEVQDEMTIKLR